LVAPVRDRLTKAEHLVFAPHDFLHHLPFHALQGPEGYLIDEFTISYAPSATVFALCMARGPSYERPTLCRKLSCFSEKRPLGRSFGVSGPRPVLFTLPLTVCSVAIIPCSRRFGCLTHALPCWTFTTCRCQLNWLF
jgi:hypothetical protein